MVALAQELGRMQGTWLEEAMLNMKTMNNSEVKESMTDDQKLDKRQEFSKAQSEFQANMQMFNMLANMTATSLKSIGEGLTSIARKQ